MASAASISLIARDGLAKATDKALGLAVRFETAVKPRPPSEAGALPGESIDPTAAPQETADVSPPSRANGARANGANGATNGKRDATTVWPRRANDGFDVRSFLVGSAVATAALTTIGGIARLVGRRY
jgi:hypothetical protein